jgi:aminoglycoside phosphotransferase (APT) family kinase protein
MSGVGLWRVELETGPHLLRMFKLEDVHVAKKEATILRHLRGTDVPVSRVRTVALADGWALLLLEWLEGLPLHETLLTTGEDPRHYGEMFGRLQANLHSVEPPDGLPLALDWPRRDAFPGSLLEAVAERSGSRSSLVHLDFLPPNVIVDGGRIRGLIDWTNAGVGDARLDIARTYLALRLLPAVGAEQRATFRPYMRSFLSGWRAAYRESARGEPEVEMAPFLAWAAFGIIDDLGRKDPALLPSGARSDLKATFRHLRRLRTRWMRAAGL